MNAIAISEYKAALPQWLARVVAAHRGGELAETAARLGAEPGIVHEIRGATSAVTEVGVAALAGEGGAVRAFARQARASSAFLALVAEDAFQAVPAETRLVGFSVDATAALRGEGEAIPLSAVDFEGASYLTKTAAVLVCFSDGVLRNISSAGQAFINRELRAAVGQVLDEALLNSLTNTATPTYATADLSAAEVRGAIRQAASFVRTKALHDLRWLAGPTAMNALLAIESSDPKLDATGGSLAGIPILATDAVAADHLALVDAAKVAASLERLVFDVARSASLEFRDDPTGDSIAPTAANQVSLFANNASALRLIVDFVCDPLETDALAFVELVEASV